MPSFQFRSGSYVFPAYCLHCDPDYPHVGAEHLEDSQLLNGKGADKCPQCKNSPFRSLQFLALTKDDWDQTHGLINFIVEPFEGITTISQPISISHATPISATLPAYVFTNGYAAYPAYCHDCDPGPGEPVTLLANTQLSKGKGGDLCPRCKNRLLVMRDTDFANTSLFAKWHIQPRASAPSITIPLEERGPDLCLQCFVPPNTQYDPNAIAKITDSLCKGRGTATPTKGNNS